MRARSSAQRAVSHNAFRSTNRTRDRAHCHGLHAGGRCPLIDDYEIDSIGIDRDVQ
jgi:hypothetical protein